MNKIKISPNAETAEKRRNEFMSSTSNPYKLKNEVSEVDFMRNCSSSIEDSEECQKEKKEVKEREEKKNTNAKLCQAVSKGAKRYASYNTENTSTEDSYLSPHLEKIKNYYEVQSNITLVKNYGSEIYQYCSRIEKENLISPNFLLRHKIKPYTRSKMIDWMFEVFYSYQSDPPTLFLAVDIMDHYLSCSSTILSDYDIHLIGLASIFLSSKMEDLYPLRMTHIKSNISHNKFTEQEIQKKETEILRDIQFNIIYVSTYDFIQTLLADLNINNKDTIKRLKMEKHVDALNNVCVFLAKLMMLDEEFCFYLPSMKALCCIICGFDILRSNSTTFDKEMENFLQQWILFVVQSGPFNNNEISGVYSKLTSLYKNIQTSKTKKLGLNNLNKTHSFYFY